jgi:hypothetical protein
MGAADRRLSIEVRQMESELPGQGEPGATGNGIAVTRRVYAVLAAALAVIAFASSPAGARAAPYGLGAPNLDAQCPSAADCPARPWLDPLIHGGYGISYARTTIPYDAVASADSSGRCVWSGTGRGGYSNPDPHRAGREYRSYVLGWLAAARRLGLEPTIAFTAGTGPIDDPVPSAAPLDQRKYYCAVYWTLWAAARSGTPVTHVEAWNEPDVNGYRGSPAGAAADYNTAARAVSQVHADYAAVPTAQLAAGTLSTMSCARGAVCSNLADYLNDYITALDSEPAYWSFHDYDDVTAAGAEERSPYANNLQAFNSILVGRYGPGYSAPIWITEAGGRLDQPNILEPDGTAPACDNGEPDAYNPAWGGGLKVGNCLDWAPDLALAKLRQAWAAQAFHDLATLLGGRVTQVDWWTPNNAAGSGWDSALLDTAGAPRSSYCVLAYAESPAIAATDTRCTGSPLDAGDIDGL